MRRSAEALLTGPKIQCGTCLVVQEHLTVSASLLAVWAVANAVRWCESRPVFGPPLGLWWEETGWGHKCAPTRMMPDPDELCTKFGSTCIMWVSCASLVWNLCCACSCCAGSNEALVELWYVQGITASSVCCSHR